MEIGLTTLCARLIHVQEHPARIDLNDETSCRKPLLSAVELARTFGARLHVLTLVREVEAILLAQSALQGYDLIEAGLENRIAALIRRVDATDLKPNILVTTGSEGPLIIAERRFEFVALEVGSAPDSGHSQILEKPELRP